jgi:hypothetical protein
MGFPEKTMDSWDSVDCVNDFNRLCYPLYLGVFG